MSEYRFIHDPGHGWLEVPVSELLALGIADQVSAYSYQSRNGLRAYLEEDCDFSLFARAKGWTSWPEHLIQDIYQDPTFVRDLPSYALKEAA